MTDTDYLPRRFRWTCVDSDRSYGGYGVTLRGGHYQLMDYPVRGATTSFGSCDIGVEFYIVDWIDDEPPRQCSWDGIESLITGVAKIPCDTSEHAAYRGLARRMVDDFARFRREHETNR